MYNFDQMGYNYGPILFRKDPTAATKICNVLAVYTLYNHY